MRLDFQTIHMYLRAYTYIQTNFTCHHFMSECDFNSYYSSCCSFSCNTNEKQKWERNYILRICMNHPSISLSLRFECWTLYSSNGKKRIRGTHFLWLMTQQMICVLRFKSAFKCLNPGTHAMLLYILLTFSILSN